MAGAGFKTFGVGDVLTASDVNTYLMQQSVMSFADSGARGSAIGTAVLSEGMVSYLADTDAVEVYDGSAWVGLGGGGFTASTAITATDASWSVPTLADPVVRVTVYGGGGGGGGAGSVGGSNGGTTTFSCSAGTATASGGTGGQAGDTASLRFGVAAQDYAPGAGGGIGGVYFNSTLERLGGNGTGGQATTAYFDLTGVTTASVTVGAGGAGGNDAFSYAGGDGGDGVVLFEYRAG